MSTSFLDNQALLQERLEDTQRHAAAMERQRDELVSKARLAEQRAGELEEEAVGLRDEIQVRQGRIDELSKVVQTTVALQERLDAHRDQTVEYRVRAERAEKQAATANVSLTEARSTVNDLNQINGELQKQIDWADKVKTAWLKRAEADAALDEATAA